MRVLDIDSNSDEIVHAATCREKNIEDAKKTYFGDAELQIEAESSDESSDSFSEGWIIHWSTVTISEGQELWRISTGDVLENLHGRWVGWLGLR